MTHRFARWTSLSAVCLFAAITASCAPTQQNAARTSSRTPPPAEAPAKSATAAAPASTTAVSAAPLRRYEISEAQTLLNQLGYSAGEADGVVGERSRAAALAYQNRVGDAPDGVFDRDLLVRLRQSTAHMAPVSAAPAVQKADPPERMAPKPKPQPVKAATPAPKASSKPKQQTITYDAPDSTDADGGGGGGGSGGGGGGW